MKSSLAPELLEPRVAPATLVNPTTVTYTEPDGDLVTVKFSKGTLDLAENFIFAPGGNPGTESLVELKIAAVEFKGSNITITAVKPPGGVGDGEMTVGQITANNGLAGVDLGTVKIGGTLGGITAGDTNAKNAALKALVVQAIGSGAVAALGSISKLTVARDWNGADLSVVGGANPNESKFGSIGTFTIGGSVFNEMVSGTTMTVDGNISQFSVTGEFDGATLTAFGSMGKVTLGKMPAGNISAAKFGNILVKGDFDGRFSLFGFGSSAKFGNVTVEGNFLGVLQSTGSVGKVLIKGNFAEGTNFLGPLINATKISSLEIQGALSSGTITGSTSIGKLTVLQGMTGGRVEASAVSTLAITGGLSSADPGVIDFYLSIDKVGKATINGDILNAKNQLRDVSKFTLNGNLTGTAELSFSGPKTGTLKITGGLGEDAELFVSAAKTTTVAGTVAGELSGDAAGTVNTGPVSGALSFDAVKTLNINGDLTGGESLFVGGRLGALKITGAYMPDAAFAGILAGQIGSATFGSIVGTASDPAEIFVTGGLGTKTGVDLAIGPIKVLHDITHARILAGFGFSGELLNEDAQIGAVTVQGNWSASSLVAGRADTNGDGTADADTSSLSPGEETTIAKIGAITIKGTATGTASPTDDHFGIVAEKLTGLKIGGVKQTLTNLADDLAIQTDFHARDAK